MAFKFVLLCAFALFSFAPYFFFVGVFVSFYAALFSFYPVLISVSVLHQCTVWHGVRRAVFPSQ